jgi:hypothetical protein
MYAEFVACYEAVGQAMWLKKFVSGLRVVDSIEKPLKLYCDNEPAMLYAHNNKKTKAAKHINIKFYVVKEKIQDQTISLEHISTKKMIADPLTKDLPSSMFERTLSQHGFEGKPMILDVKGSRQKSVLKQKGVLWSLCLIVRN